MFVIIKESMFAKLKNISSLKPELSLETLVERGIFIFPILFMVLFTETTHCGIKKSNGP